MKVTEALKVGNPNHLYTRLRKDSLLPNLFPLNAEQVREEWENTASRLDAGMYSPEGPVGTLWSHKSNNAIRYTPVLRSHDAFLYHKLTSALEDALVKERKDGTFGAFHGGGVWRSADEANEKQVAERYLLREEDLERSRRSEHPEEPEWEEVAYAGSALNKFQWVKDWKGYSRTLRCYSEGEVEWKHVAIYDLANFYDSIELHRLQRLMRHSIKGRQQLLCLEVLIHFLEHWNKGANSYSSATKGVPQDTIGEASRLLANFYLTPHDQDLISAVDLAGAKFARYSDDMILFARTPEELRTLFSYSSQLLHQLGLSVNASKVRWMTIEQFYANWRFDIISTIEAGDHVTAVEELQKTSRKNPKPERFDMLMKLLFTKHTQATKKGEAKLSSKHVDWLIRYMSQPKVLQGLRSYNLGCLIDNSGNPELKASWIVKRAKSSDYTRFQIETYHALREREGKLSDLVDDMRSYAINSGDPCLALLTH